MNPSAPTDHHPPVVDLTCEEVRELLSQFVDRALPEPAMRGVERHLKTCQPCKGELRMLQVEEHMLKDALSDLRPSKSHRGRVARMCEDVHEKAEKVANSLPEQGWAIFRWSYAALVLLVFLGLHFYLGIPTKSAAVEEVPELGLLYRINAAMFFLGLVFTAQGHRLAELKYWLTRRYDKPSENNSSVRAVVLTPTRLEKVLLQACGLLVATASLVLHFLYLLR